MGHVYIQKPRVVHLFEWAEVEEVVVVEEEEEEKNVQISTQ